eukprot:354781-Pleurochrysis_carterae.AAC.2
MLCMRIRPGRHQCPAAWLAFRFGVRGLRAQAKQLERHHNDSVRLAVATRAFEASLEDFCRRRATRCIQRASRRYLAQVAIRPPTKPGFNVSVAQNGVIKALEPHTDDAVAAHETRVSMQLYHSGRATSPLQTRPFLGLPTTCSACPLILLCTPHGCQRLCVGEPALCSLDLECHIPMSCALNVNVTHTPPIQEIRAPQHSFSSFL